jgi:hypothetical protein
VERHGIGVNPNVEVVGERFRLNTARDVWVEPGRYEFNEYFIFWMDHPKSAVSAHLVRSTRPHPLHRGDAGPLECGESLAGCKACGHRRRR